MATSDQVQQLYLTYFGRPADPEGLQFWTSDLTTPITVIADGFATTPEFTAQIVGKSFTQIVNQFYVSLFGRNGEPAGISFWVDLLTRGLTTVQQVGLNISSAALALPPTNADNIAVTSKIVAATNWTAEVFTTTEGILAYSGTPGIDAGVAFLTPVLTTATIPDAAATTAAVDNLIASNSGVGLQADLSVFQDIFTPTSAVRLTIPGGDLVETLLFRFTSESESVSAAIGSLQASDTLIDPSALDEDNLNITIAPGFGVITEPGTTNIENYFFFLANADRGLIFDFDALGAVTQTGVKKVTITGTINANPVGPVGFNVLDFGDSGATMLDASGVTTPGVAGGIFATGFAVLGPDNQAVTLIGGAGNDDFFGGDSSDTLIGNAGIDDLDGLDGADTIDGGSAADLLDGGPGDDSINGGADGDLILGGLGADTILGDAGNDTIAGGVGNDTITGGAGADIMTGDSVGIDLDIFAYGSLTQLVADTGITALTTDVITDFAAGAGLYKIQTGLAGTATNFINPGVVFGDFDAGRLFANTLFDGAIQYVAVDGVGALGSVLYVDADADNTADAAITFADFDILVASDIIA